MAVAGSGKLTAVGAVVVGRDEEGSIRIDRLAVKGQMFNTLRFRVNGLTFTVPPESRFLHKIFRVLRPY